LSSRPSDLWIPGAAGPSIDDFVDRLIKAIESFAARRGWDEAVVEVQLHDGTNFALHSIRPEPGYGFLTLCPYPDDAERPWPKDRDAEGSCPPDEMIVPVGSIVRITLGEADEPRRLGFSKPAEPARRTPRPKAS
jgi:hypothetical protein